MFVRQWTFVIAIAFAIGVGVGTQLPTQHATIPQNMAVYFTPGTKCKDRIIAEISHATDVAFTGSSSRVTGIKKTPDGVVLFLVGTQGL